MGARVSAERVRRERWPVRVVNSMSARASPAPLLLSRAFAHEPDGKHAENRTRATRTPNGCPEICRKYFCSSRASRPFVPPGAIRGGTYGNITRSRAGNRNGARSVTTYDLRAYQNRTERTIGARAQ